MRHNEDTAHSGNGFVHPSKERLKICSSLAKVRMKIVLRTSSGRLSMLCCSASERAVRDLVVGPLYRAKDNDWTVRERTGGVG